MSIKLWVCDIGGLGRGMIYRFIDAHLSEYEFNIVRFKQSQAAVE
jgi:hypothetical protein